MRASSQEFPLTTGLHLAWRRISCSMIFKLDCEVVVKGQLERVEARVVGCERAM